MRYYLTAGTRTVLAAATTLTFGLGTLGASSQKTLYLVRHGESKWNEAQSDVNLVNMMKTVDHPLNGTGIEQANKLNTLWTAAQAEW